MKMQITIIRKAAGSLCFGLTAAVMMAANSVSAETADYVFKNGAIYTMDGQNPKAQAIAVSGKHIAYVGNNDGAQAFIGDKTKVTDLKGQMLLPGFVEAHIHPNLAFFTKGADLQCDTVQELLARVKAQADAHPDAKAIQGFGWRYILFPTTGPNKADLDKLFPDRPVLLVAIDVSQRVGEQQGARDGGDQCQNPRPRAGRELLPARSQDRRADRLGRRDRRRTGGPGQAESAHTGGQNAATAEQLPKFAAAGITAAFDAGIATMPTECGLEGYQQLEKDGKLPLRIVGCYYWNNPEVTDPVAKVLALRDKFHSELVQVRTLKIMLDGGESQHTAVMLKPYADQPDTRGEFQINPKLIDAAVLKAQANGMDTHAHSYGDGATRAYLDAIEQARKAYPNSPSRHTAAHAMFLTDEEIRRFPKLNVTMQTSAQWFTPDPTLALILKYVGKDVVSTEYARMNSMLKAGGRLAFGTDWPASGWVATYRPLDAIQVAMTRAILPQYGKQQVMPIVPPENERITLDQALKAYTLDAAYVLGLENKIGSLQPGKAADIVVLEKDLHKIAPSEISTTKVKLTMMNGKITYRAQ